MSKDLRFKVELICAPLLSGSAWRRTFALDWILLSLGPNMYSALSFRACSGREGRTALCSRFMNLHSSKFLASRIDNIRRFNETSRIISPKTSQGTERPSRTRVCTSPKIRRRRRLERIPRRGPARKSKGSLGVNSIGREYHTGFRDAFITPLGSEYLSASINRTQVDCLSRLHMSEI